MRKIKVKTKEKLIKTNKGITLIALVITIIVLLILAGVSIAMLTGENGILTQAQNAKNRTEEAQADEENRLNEYNNIINNYVNGENTGGDEKQEKEPIEVGTSYIANFADMNNDGVADGIIYADLAVGGSGMWNDNDWSNYSYEAKTGLKEYYIENENYTEPKFGNKSGKLIAPIEGSSGEDRFYVMALKDMNPGVDYYWYSAAYGKLDKIVDTGYNDFGTGKENTAYVMDKWVKSSWGTQNDSLYDYDDLWGEIQDKVIEGWFVPSKSEWSAFGDIATKKLGLTEDNYTSYCLQDWYWSSSQRSANGAYTIEFINGWISADEVKNYAYSVRLSKTF